MSFGSLFWKPTNPRLASNMPLTSLEKVFIFTDSDGKAVLQNEIALGTLSDTIGGPAAKQLIGKYPIEVIAKSNVGKTIAETYKFPDEGWAAMQRIDSINTARAITGTVKMVVRTYKDPRTNENGAIVLLYRLS